MQRKPLVHANGRGLQSKDPDGDITVIRFVGGAVGGMSVLVMTALAVWEAEVVDVLGCRRPTSHVGIQCQ